MGFLMPTELPKNSTNKARVARRVMWLLLIYGHWGMFLRLFPAFVWSGYCRLRLFFQRGGA